MFGTILAGRGGALLAALVNLNHPARTIHWGWFLISAANLVVVALMIVVFVVAVVVPFPGERPRRKRP